MDKRKVNILEFPTNLGLKATAPPKEPGVKELPDWLREHGLHRRIRPHNIARLEPFSYGWYIDGESGVGNADKIVLYAKEQAKILSQYLDQGGFQLVLGGDCSVLIGNALALKKKGVFGLLFLDGHTDFMPTAFSRSKAAAGMDLSLVTGHGHPKLTDIHGLGPYFEESHVFCLGNRENSPGYVEHIVRTDIQYHDLLGIREKGMKRTAMGFLEMVDEKELDGFFVHLDVDVLDHRIMPAVDAPQEDGLSYDELSELLLGPLSSPKVMGMEITILDPSLDREGRATKLFIREMVGLLGKVGSLEIGNVK